MHEVLQDYCSDFWRELDALQYARGLVATPYPLCSMSIGVHLSALLHITSCFCFPAAHLRSTSTFLRCFYEMLCMRWQCVWSLR